MPGPGARYHALRRCLLSALLLGLPGAVLAAFVATTDRTEISDADTIRLTLQYDGEEGSSRQPDLSPLAADFEQLSIGTRQSVRTAADTSYREWIVTLRPRQLGRLTIPPLDFAGQRTDPILVTVSSVSSRATSRRNELAFLETDVDSDEAYVQSQIVYVVRFFYRNTVEGDLPIVPRIEDALVKQLGDEKNYESFLGGVRFNVREFRYSIFPQRSVPIVIEKLSFRVRAVVTRGLLWSREYEDVDVSAPGHRIEVKPRPSAFSGADWLPASALEISEQWTSNPPSLVVGEPINRTISIEASGLLGSVLPPLGSPELDHVNLYADPPIIREAVGNRGLVSSRVESVGVLPVSEGTVQFPAIAVPWWNTRTDREEVAVIPAASYSIRPAAEMPAAPPLGGPVGAVVNAPIGDRGESSPLTTLAIVVTIIGAATFAGWWVTRRRLLALEPVARQDLANEPASQSENRLYRRLRATCKAGGPAAVRQAVIAWGRVAFGDEGARTLADISRLCEHEPFREAARDLDARLFAASQPATWDASALLAAVEDLHRGRRTKSHRPARLPELN